MENDHDIEFGDEFLYMISKTWGTTRKKYESHCHQNLKYTFIKHQKQLEKDKTQNRRKYFQSTRVIGDVYP